MSSKGSSNRQIGGTAIQDRPMSMENFLNQFDDTPLDDVLPQPVTVTWVDFVEQEAKDEEDQLILDAEGQPEIIRVPRMRKSVISTYVPMKVFHRMIASQEKLGKLKLLKAQGKISDDERNETMAWVIDQVAEVWRLTEPKMTNERLEEALTFEKIFGLFNRFFGNLLLQWSTQKLS